MNWKMYWACLAAVVGGGGLMSWYLWQRGSFYETGAGLFMMTLVCFFYVGDTSLIEQFAADEIHARAERSSWGSE